jgi:hypothetical protein
VVFHRSATAGERTEDTIGSGDRPTQRACDAPAARLPRASRLRPRRGALQLFQQRLGVLQVGGVETFGEPAVDLRASRAPRGDRDTTYRRPALRAPRPGRQVGIGGSKRKFRFTGKRTSHLLGICPTGHAVGMRSADRNAVARLWMRFRVRATDTIMTESGPLRGRGWLQSRRRYL